MAQLTSRLYVCLTLSMRRFFAVLLESTRKGSIFRRIVITSPHAALIARLDATADGFYNPSGDGCWATLRLCATLRTGRGGHTYPPRSLRAAYAPGSGAPKRCSGIREETAVRFLPIASGKGGVGKSLLSANLALLLGTQGKRVVLVDFDLGGSNLHLILGHRRPGAGLGNYLSGDTTRFGDIVHETDYENVRFIPGEGEIPGLANTTVTQRRRVVRELRKLDADFIIIDLGAGTGATVTDLFLTTNRSIVVTTPAPTSTVNAYLLLKSAVFRIINQSFKKGSPGDAHLRRLQQNGVGLQRIYVQRLLADLSQIDPKGFAVAHADLAKFQPRLVLNLVQDPKDAERAHRLRRSCRQYLGVDIEHLGVIYRDPLQETALGARLPIVRYKPHSVLSEAVRRLATRLLQTEDDDPWEIEDLDETFDLADSSAGDDFEARVGYVQELLSSGTLSTGDLIETVTAQQLEIRELRNQNALYKNKLVRAAQQGFKV